MNWTDLFPRIHFMKPQRQPTEKTCAVTCLAMLLDVPVASLIKPGKERHSFEELKDIAFVDHNRSLVEITLSPYEADTGKSVWSSTEVNSRLLWYTQRMSGILTLKLQDKHHAVVWDHVARLIYDPDEDEPHTFAKLATIPMVGFYYLA